MWDASNDWLEDILQERKTPYSDQTLLILGGLHYFAQGTALDSGSLH
jgi:hypothetical protein